MISAVCITKRPPFDQQNCQTQFVPGNKAIAALRVSRYTSSVTKVRKLITAALRLM